ncbi:MAG: rhodanese-like domain-containing protein [Verrucomicrobiota bacterium]|nr:rhodanese-like domain-containing protein [Verrucomicrobiota bacterium]
MASTAQPQEIDANITMGDVLDRFPGAKRALFAAYHIGGCQSCSYDSDETLAEVCERNENLPVDEVINHILQAHETDQKILIDPSDLAEALKSESAPRLLDLRTSEEHEAVALPGSEMFSNDLMQDIFGNEPKDRMIVMYDHTGDKVLDAAAYLIGHGYKNTRALRGGIDAYAQEVDSSISRYRLEFEDPES